MLAGFTVLYEDSEVVKSLEANCVLELFVKYRTHTRIIIFCMNEFVLFMTFLCMLYFFLQDIPGNLKKGNGFLYTPYNGGMCGLTLQIGKKYFISGMY